MKTLLVYYSKDGNTKKIVDLVTKKIETDSFDAVTDRVYDSNDWTASDQALEEFQRGKLPALVNPIPAMDDYDLILIAGPVWGQSISNPIRRFFQDADLTGKRVSGFWTFWDHDEYYNKTMKTEAEKDGAVYIKGLPVPRSLTGAKLDRALEHWIATLS